MPEVGDRCVEMQFQRVRGRSGRYIGARSGSNGLSGQEKVKRCRTQRQYPGNTKMTRRHDMMTEIDSASRAGLDRIGTLTQDSCIRYGNAYISRWAIQLTFHGSCQLGMTCSGQIVP